MWKLWYDILYINKNLFLYDFSCVKCCFSNVDFCFLKSYLYSKISMNIVVIFILRFI